MDRSIATAKTSLGNGSVNLADVRISVCIEVGEAQRHFEVRAPTFDDAYAELTRRLTRAGYKIAGRTTVVGSAT